MHNKSFHKSRCTPRRRGTLPPGAVQLGLERLEERALMAADLPFQNPNNRFDVNNDGAFNRLDIYALIGALRLGGERRLSPAAGGAEGEGPSAGGTFYDVNGDDYFDRRDIFSSIGQLRAEGEQNPSGNPVMMNYIMRVFSADGKTEFLDPDGAGPLGITIPKDEDFLLRVFVQDTGAVQNLFTRVPGEEGIGTFSLDVGYHQAGSDLLGEITPNLPVHFEGTVTDVGNPAGPKLYQFPNNTLVESEYVDGVTPAIDNAALFRVEAIQGTVRDPFTFLGLGEIMAFEIPFTAGSVLNTKVVVETLEFTPQAGQRRIEATQDNQNVNADTNNDGVDDIFTNAQIQDDQVILSIVDNTFANPDLIIMHEQPGPVAADITIDAKANDFGPTGKTKGVDVAGAVPLPTHGTVAVDDKGTADHSDDVIVYTPNSPYFVGTDTFGYKLLIFDNPTDTTPIDSRTGTVTIDFREFNFTPIVSAPGVDEAALGASLTIRQGDTQTFLKSVILGNDVPGDLADISPAINDEARPHQDLHIVGDPNFNAPPFTPINPAQIPFVVPAAAARSISVNASGNLVFVAEPTFVGPAVIHYFVEDNGLEQSLAPLTAQAAVVTPKRTEATLNINITDRPDLVRYTVAFFDTAGNPLNGEVDVNFDFVARVFVQDLRDPLTGPPGVNGAFLDLQFDDLIGGVQVINTVPTPTIDFNIDGTPSLFATGGTSAGFFAPNLLDNAGGFASAPGTTSFSTPLAVFDVNLHSGNPTSGATSIFSPLFAKNQGLQPGGPDTSIFTSLAPPNTQVLDEAQISFVAAPLLVARGFRPIANNDFVYTLDEGTTLTVSDPGDTHGNAAAFPGPTVVAFDPTKGVLNNDTDEDAVANPVTNELFGEIVSLAGITHGVLSLEDPNNLGTFIPVTGPNAQAPPPGWKGTFRYVPLTTSINGTDTFTYRVVDSDGRRSLAPATVTLQINSVAGDPVAVDDRYDVAVAPAVLTVNAEGNLKGNLGGAQLPLTSFGVLNNDFDLDVNGDPSAPASTTNILTAVLLSLPSVGTLTVIDSTNTPHVINDIATDFQGFTWTGMFIYEPDANVRGVIDTFTYQAVDETARLSNVATVSIGIDLLNITLKGRVFVDDSQPAPGTNPYPNTLGPNGRFEFQDINGTGVFDAGDKLIERTLGGVTMTLVGVSLPQPPNQAFPVAVATKTNSAGEFNFFELFNGNPIPAGDYQLIQDPRLKTFFFDGVDTFSASDYITIGSSPPIITQAVSQGGVVSPGSSNDSQAVLDQFTIDHGAADILFGEYSLRPQFFLPFLVSSSRSGVTIGLDNNNQIVFYSIDSGPGWSNFDHQITGVTFANGKAILTFTEPNPTVGQPPVTVNVAVPTSDGLHFSQVVDPATGYRLIRFAGTAATLKTLYQV